MTRYRPLLNRVVSKPRRRANSLSASAPTPPSLERLLAVRLRRRDILRGGLVLAASTIFAGAGLAGCGGDDEGNDNGGGGSGDFPSQLRFSSVDGTGADQVVVPKGYTAQALLAWGTPILPGAAAFAPGSNTAEDQAGQTGMHHDGLHFFPISEDSSEHGLMVINHENVTRPSLFFPDGPALDADGRPTDPDQVRKEINAHGISVVELERHAGGWQRVQGGFNRRITGASPMQLSGPATGSPLLVTPYSPGGTKTRGTLNNCGRGFTPWGTYLTCEENFAGYFATDDPDPPRYYTRYGVKSSPYHSWFNVAGHPSEENGEFARFDVTPNGAGPTEDYRHEANGFGWIVEIDPFSPSSIPIKRTAMGRIAHEGAQPGAVEGGRQIAFYMGDDNEGEYFYKFVTADAYNPDSPNPNMLDNGTLYVAKFEADGTGIWLPLDIRDPALSGAFATQGELLINTRTAADIVGATPMDRPEWNTTDPNSGEIYLTLTNYDKRGTPGKDPTNAVNPRKTNVYGHVIRLREGGDEPAATDFEWDIFVFGSPANADPSVNRSGLTLENEFGGPDGLYFDHRGVLWIQTDNGDPLSGLPNKANDQMLAVIPSQLPTGTDGVSAPVVTPENQASLKRFLVGPVNCEITGAYLTQDARTMFINVQHPGGFGASGSQWPDGSIPARAATVAITRDDGGEIAL